MNWLQKKFPSVYEPYNRIMFMFSYQPVPTDLLTKRRVELAMELKAIFKAEQLKSAIFGMNIAFLYHYLTRNTRFNKIKYVLAILGPLFASCFLTKAKKRRLTTQNY